MMDKINEIYKEMVQESEEMKVLRKKVEECIENILAGRKKEMKQTEYELCRDLFYQVAMVAEEAGFSLGFQYAAQLMAECYMEKSIVKPE